jgi:tRNA (guanine37-N1)-methyltransferase
MIIRADVLGDAIDSVISKNKNTKIIFLSPRGKKFDQNYACKAIENKEILLICGRFEGIDQRIIDYYNIEELSLGDYIISGGELGAMILIDSCVRCLPGVLGNHNSLDSESFSNNMLEYSQYTRPKLWKGLAVPEVLLSGNHKLIAEWRYFSSLENTINSRPDLIKR